MGKVLIENSITTPSNPNYLSESSYDFNKWNLWKWWIFNNGSTQEDKYFQAHLAAIRPMEESTPFAVVQISVHNFSTTVAYIFWVENLVTASATRRIALWEMNRKTWATQWKWFITLTLSSATAHTVRDFKMDIKNESTGTASVSWATVTGTGTSFLTNWVSVGARIWFGSTDPSQITTWYRVNAVTNNTTLTLASSIGTISNWQYVIQEFRPIYTATNATLTNGGIHYAKWVSIEDFIITGTTIPLAVSTDNQKAVYWLKDASTQTNTIACWAAVDFDSATPTNLDMYVLDMPVAWQYRVFKYNLHAALTVAAGASVNAFVLATGNNAFTWIWSQNANLCIWTTSHGSWNGIKSLYCVSTTRVMRIPVSSVVSASTTFISESIAEITPWWAQTFPSTNALSTIEYMSSIDAFIIWTTHAAGAFSYVTQYVNSWQQFQRMFGREYKFRDQSTKDNWHPSIFTNSSTMFAYTDAWANRIFAVKQGTTQSLNQIYMIAFGADWDYASTSNGRLISPKILTPNCLWFNKAHIDNISYLWNTSIGKSSEPYRVYARTSNIETDMTSWWILLNNLRDLSWFAWADAIQFAIEVRVIGETCLPPRILWLWVSYNDNNTDSHYQPCADLSDKVNKRFAWRFSTAFWSSVPTLRVRLYDATTNWLLVSDTTVSPTGTWEKSIDWTTWTAYNTTDKWNETTYIRYTPASLADNVQVAYLLTLN